MTTRITWLGHAAFQIDSAGRTVLIDPFLSGNPVATVEAGSLAADAIVLTHGHEDHVGDTVEIAKRTGALVIANFEITEWLRKKGVENLHAQHIGGAHDHGFAHVKLTIAHHGSMLPDGSNGGNPCGVMLKTADGTIYHAGDSGLFGDMRLIGEEGIAVAILPIGDNYTMGPDDSLRALRLIEPRHVIPCHYNTWPLIAQDALCWAQRVRAETRAEPVVLEPGAAWELS
ncbi:MAG: metal-dependent hydrolase [Planctomycetes bacterium]|nr:metal-dependent hydrolase [Planctomycetota bacterium]